MKVIEKYNHDWHNPRWRFQLGPISHQTQDTPQRVSVIRKYLDLDDRFDIMPAERFPERLLARIHPYHDFIKNVSESLKTDSDEFYPDLFPGDNARIPKRVDNPLWGGMWCTDAVTPIKRRTYEVARASADCALTGAELLCNQLETTVYALCRPAGHHAGPRVFGGYCYFNNVATAAEYLLPHGSVAILDIDYHHGNGTQEYFFQRKHVYTASIHADPAVAYPYFWGYADETGHGQGEGANFNIPLTLDSDATVYHEALDQVLEAVRRFQPRFFLVSAGFDTHKSDPIGGFQLEVEDFAILGRKIADLNIPTLICQEGGYNITVLGQCVAAFLGAFT